MGCVLIDVRFATLAQGSEVRGVPSLIGDDDYLKGDFIATVQQRGAAVIKARGASSAASAACAICDHMRDWILGSHGHIVSMGVVSDDSPYGVARDLVFSFPVICEPGGRFSIVGLDIDAFSKVKLAETEAELLAEKSMAFD